VPEFGTARESPRRLAEKLRLLGVLPPLAVHDVLELGMAGHCGSRDSSGKWMGKRGLIGREPGKIKESCGFLAPLVEGLSRGQASLTMTSCTDERMRRELQSPRARHGVWPVSKASGGTSRACPGFRRRAQGCRYPDTGGRRADRR